ncbi:neuronal-specific septin-3 isoform X1 [Echeneis naucrates]|nr:neuronal-specific septin-3 isoform X1 [Echeneis naucrates]
MSSAGQGGKQPSPVAKERCARSITISNTKFEPKQKFSNEAKHDLLDQDALLDFTRTHLRRSCTMNGRQTRSESHIQTDKGTKKENSSKYKPNPPPRNLEFSAIPKPKSNIKQQQGLLPSAVTGTQTFLSESESTNVLHRESQSVFDKLTSQSKCADYTQNRYYAQNKSTTSNNKLDKTNCGTALPTMPEMLFSPKPCQRESPHIEANRRQLDLHKEAKMETTFPSGTNLQKLKKENNAKTVKENSWRTLFQQSEEYQHIESPQKHRFWQKPQSQTAQMDVESTASQTDCVTKDYMCHSSGIDQKMEASQCAHRLNRLKTCLVVPQTQEVPRPSSAELTTAHTGNFSKFDIISCKQLVDRELSPAQNNSRKEVTLSDIGLNQTDIFALPGHHSVPTKLLERPSEKCVVSWPPSVAGCPFNTNSHGIGSKGVFDLPSQPQHKVCQRPEKTTSSTAASFLPKQVDYSFANRAFIMEEPEDPYYVTMYYPGSVYVDMSDVVPPEVRPKPVVPAKPSNVGAPSPSSPFPPQGPSGGAGSVGISAPPSGIPVPIGTHGPNLAISHAVGHGLGHGVGHTAAHSGHGLSSSHNSSGGSTLLGYIGIDTIIEQMRKKTMKTGFDFNIMVVGHSGLGKSTLVNTLFKSHVSRKSAGWARDEKIPKTVEIKAVSHVIEEGGVKMKLTVVDTPGFGDQINNDNCWEPISKYINEQYEKFLKEEVNITRKKRIPDTRVHCCIYFISPTGHFLRQLDTEFMKRLSHSVNIIPVIAKADTMTLEERQEFKQRVRKELEVSGIEFYPQKEFDEDMEDKSDNDKIREAMPFAVVGSDKEYQVNGKRVLGRKTAWGIVEVENPNHCEFAQLRDFLIRSHLQDLKEVTHNIHYETYRAKRLNENGEPDGAILPLKMTTWTQF